MPTAINQLHNCGIWGDLGSCNFQQALLKLRRSPSRPHRFWSSSEQPSLHHSPDQMGICVSQACGFALLKHINNGARILVHGCQKRGEQSFWYISPSPSPPDSCILAWRNICILKKYATVLGNRLQGTWGLCSQVNKGVRDQKEFIISLH